MSAPARYATARDTSRPTRGAEIAGMAAALKRELLPWQQQVVDTALEYDAATGDYVYDTVVITVPRQSGKSFLVGLVAEHRCLTVKNARVWYTAQTGIAASAWMRDEHQPMFELSSVFKGKFRTRNSTGSEMVRWPSGSTFTVFPPQRDAMHGKQSDLTFLDECWAHTAAKGAELKQAIRPTMATRPGSQVWVLSTMGDDTSALLQSYVDAGRASVTNPASRIAYFEWSIPEEADPEDMDLVVSHHPAIGHTIQRSALEAAREDFGTDVAGWARAYGNRATHSRTAAFPYEVWQRCGDAKPPLPARFGVAYDVVPDGSRAAVVAAWRDGNGHAWVEILRDDAGAAWVPDYLDRIGAEHKVPIGYDTAGVATLSVADELARRRSRTTMRGLTTNEFATSCVTLAATVMNGELRHSRQGPLDRAVEVATKRPILDGGWAWGRKTSSDSIAPLVAATVALRMFDDLPKQRRLTVLTAREAS